MLSLVLLKKKTFCVLCFFSKGLIKSHEKIFNCRNFCVCAYMLPLIKTYFVEY